MLRDKIRSGIVHVGLALREPEEFACRSETGAVHYPWWVWVALGLTAMLGTTTYGMTMGLMQGTPAIFSKGLLCTLAAGLAWGIPLPALYILNSLFWPLYLPTLLDRPGRPAPPQESPSAPAANPADSFARAIAQVEAELETALDSLDGWAENVLAREQDRFAELRSAWRLQAERIRQLDHLLSTA